MTLIRFYPDCFRKCFTFLFGKLFFYYSSHPSSSISPLSLPLSRLYVCFHAYAFVLLLLLLLSINRASFFFPFNSYSLCFMLAWMYEQLQSYREQWLMSNKWGKRPHTQFYSTTHKLMPTCHTRWQKYSFLIQTYTHGWWWWKKNFLWQIYEAFTMTKLVNDVSHKGGWMMKTPCYTHSIASGLWGGRK